MLEAKNIHKDYDNSGKKLAVLKGIDLKIEKSEFVAITGPSGAGKSTLLHIIAGLDAPSNGEVIFEGDNLYQLKDTVLSGVRNSRIGFIFQFYHLLPEFTVIENILLPARIKKAGSQKERAMALLRQVGLLERIDHFPSQLSGGEKQRAAIVRALINSPQILFCDEPTGNLDSACGEEIISLIKEINQKEKMTVVLVTHNLELTRFADKTYHLRDGRLAN